MATNLPPEYFEADKRYRAAKTPGEKISCIEELSPVIMRFLSPVGMVHYIDTKKPSNLRWKSKINLLLFQLQDYSPRFASFSLFII